MKRTLVVEKNIRVNAVHLTSNYLVAYTCLMGNKDAIFKALSDSTRRLIVDELSNRNEQTLYELTVRLISNHDIAISRQGIAKHLSVLEDAGLVNSKRKGKYRVLMFNNEPLKNLLNGWIE
jgi:DNA-binding transcriptional ArsR family regulator